jgi:hypothetical protein
MTVRQRHQKIRDRLVVILKEQGPLSTRELMDSIHNMTTVKDSRKKLRFVPTINELSNLLARDMRFFVDRHQGKIKYWDVKE